MDLSRPLRLILVAAVVVTLLSWEANGALIALKGAHYATPEEVQAFAMLQMEQKVEAAHGERSLQRCSAGEPGCDEPVKLKPCNMYKGCSSCVRAECGWCNDNMGSCQPLDGANSIDQVCSNVGPGNHKSRVFSVWDCNEEPEDEIEAMHEDCREDKKHEMGKEIDSLFTKADDKVPNGGELESVNFEFHQPVNNDFDGWTLYLFDDFEDGAGTWSVSHVTTCGAVSLLGGYLSTQGPQGEFYTHISGLPRHSHIRIKAEVFFIDDWEREFVYLKVDDRAVWSKDCLSCGRKGRNFCGSNKYQDTLGVPLDVALPHKNELVRITMGSSSRSPSAIKSWGMANLMVLLSEKCGDMHNANTANGGHTAPSYEGMKMGPAEGLVNPGCGDALRKLPFTTYAPKEYVEPPCSEAYPGFNCKWCKDQPGGNRGDGVYWINPVSGHKTGAVQVYCDMSTDGGGWTLFVAYAHEAGTNPEKQKAIPTDPVKGFSHMSLDDLGVADDQFSEVRFYCESDSEMNEGRKIHFKTVNPQVLLIAKTWNQHARPQHWSEFAVPLPGHTAHLPKSTNHVYRQRWGGFFEFPFYQAGTAHWAIRGGGDRWECDDYDYAKKKPRTLHQVWFR